LLKKWFFKENGLVLYSFYHDIHLIIFCMKPRKLIYLIILLVISATVSAEQKIENGVLDLSNINFTINNQSIKLSGDVEFYWNQLYTPSDFKNPDLLTSPELVKIPKSWTSYSINNEKLPSNGFATYRWWIDIKGISTDQILGIKIPSVFTSYKLWINGNLTAQAGTVATTDTEHAPRFLIDDIPFVIPGTTEKIQRIQVVIQVSNFSHRRAGLAWPSYIGSFETLKRESRNLDILNLLVIGIILIIGLNHIIMFLFRRKDVSNLYFGILSLVMILRNISTGDRLLAYIFPNISWEFLLSIDNFSGYCTIPFFALFIYNLYKNEFPTWIKNLMVGLGGLFGLFIFATPAAIFGKFNMIFELYLLVGGLYLTFGVLLIATFKGREGAIFTFIGMFFLYATAINDVLSSMELIQTPYVAPYGLVTFMLLQSFTMTSKSGRAINQNEALSIELAKEKESLEQKVEERTSELQSQHKAVLDHQEREKIQNWIGKGLAKVNQVLSVHKDNFDVLSRKVLTTLVKYLGAKLGALYIIDDEGEQEQNQLQLVAHYGGNKQMIEQNATIEPGKGLVGATFTDNQIQVINNIPDSYYEINSGLGSSKPKCILLVPLSTEDNVLGVLEMARFEEFKPEEIDFIKKIAFNIASSLYNVKMNDRNINLIKQFQDQAAELQEKEERMRESLEELEFYRENYLRTKSELDQIKGDKNG
jgi:putative methionine-R-sulfoxide reductase with GAF domain